MKNQHIFDISTALSKLDGRKFEGCTNTNYNNVVGTHGGITAATLLRCVIEDEEAQGAPVAQTVNFCAAIQLGNFQVQSAVDRTGKYTQHWTVELVQDEKVKAKSSVVLGNRQNSFSQQYDSMPEVSEPRSYPALKTKGLINWLEAYDFRFVEGEPSFTGHTGSEQASSRSMVWISDKKQRNVDPLSIAAYSDCFFSRILQAHGRMVPFGTVSLTTYIHATPDELKKNGSSPILGVVETSRMHKSFHNQNMQLWSSNGLLLATGNQLVWYKDR